MEILKRIIGVLILLNVMPLLIGFLSSGGSLEEFIIMYIVCIIIEFSILVTWGLIHLGFKLIGKTNKF